MIVVYCDRCNGALPGRSTEPMFTQTVVLEEGFGARIRIDLNDGESERFPDLCKTCRDALMAAAKEMVK